MNVDQYIEIFHRTDLDGLNDAVSSLEGQHRLDVLKALEAQGFEVMWHRDEGRVDAGVVMAGPSPSLGAATYRDETSS